MSIVIGGAAPNFVELGGPGCGLHLAFAEVPVAVGSVGVGDFAVGEAERDVADEDGDVVVAGGDVVAARGADADWPVAAEGRVESPSSSPLTATHHTPATASAATAMDATTIAARRRPSPGPPGPLGLPGPYGGAGGPGGCGGPGGNPCGGPGGCGGGPDANPCAGG